MYLRQRRATSVPWDGMLRSGRSTVLRAVHLPAACLVDPLLHTQRQVSTRTPATAVAPGDSGGDSGARIAVPHLALSCIVYILISKKRLSDVMFPAYNQRHLDLFLQIDYIPPVRFVYYRSIRSAYKSFTRVDHSSILQHVRNRHPQAQQRHHYLLDSLQPDGPADWESIDGHQVEEQ